MAVETTMRPRAKLLLLSLVLALAGLVIAPRPALAAPAGASGGATASAGKSGKSGTTATTGKSGAKSGANASGSGKGKGKKGDYQLPDFVYGGNAISFQSPLQIGFVAYMPRVRLGLQYDRQLHKPHWVHLGVAALLDRGNHETFRTGCGFPTSTTGVCDSGTVAGMDAYLGYTHKWYLKERPFLVPYGKLSVGGGFWKYPNLGGVREQYRVSTWSLSVRAGLGLRIFLLRELALGVDLNLHVGFAAHRDLPQNAAAEKSGQFLMGLEILPLLIEYRF